MLIKILKGEQIFSEHGTHVCDDNGFAIIASQDMECEVNNRIETVIEILKEQRAIRGLDQDGNPLKNESDDNDIDMPPNDAITKDD